MVEGGVQHSRRDFFFLVGIINWAVIRKAATRWQCAIYDAAELGCPSVRKGCDAAVRLSGKNDVTG